MGTLPSRVCRVLSLVGVPCGVVFVSTCQILVFFFSPLAQKLYYEFALVSFHFFFSDSLKIERGWLGPCFVCLVGARTVFYG